MTITTVGLDLAKSVFQVHCIDRVGAVILRKKLRRSEVRGFFRSLGPCRIGMEACATAQLWAREIGALGHDVRMTPPSYVKVYLRRQKTDAADAEAICEAVTRPSMRFVPMKSAERQSALVMGAILVVRRAKSDALAAGPWVRSLLERRPARVVTVAMANKTARIASAVLARGGVYRVPGFGVTEPLRRRRRSGL